jgi:hypothetical protein
MKLPRLTYPTLALGLACAVPAVAHATVIYNEIMVKDALGHVLASVTASPDDVTDPAPVFFYVPGIAVDTSEFGEYGVVVDAGGNPLELFGIAGGGPDDANLSFGSSGAAAQEPIQNAVLNTGAPIDMTQFLDPALREAGDTAAFIVSVVPEPLTWAMMLVGFAAMGGVMRRARQIRRTSLHYC